MRIIKWRFGSDNDIMKSTELAIGKKVLISKGQYKGLQFCIDGLGLTKAEREIFRRRFLQFDGILNIYLGKLIISYDRNGIYDSLKHVVIYSDRPLLRRV
jgi:hypothetical protein